jgi:hypothetical protein
MPHEPIRAERQEYRARGLKWHGRQLKLSKGRTVMANHALWRELQDKAFQAIKVAELEMVGIRELGRPPERTLRELQSVCSRLEDAFDAERKAHRDEWIANRRRESKAA